MKALFRALFGLLFLFTVALTLCLAQDTNAIPPLPGLTPAGAVDVVSLINLAILAATPIVTQATKFWFPKLPAVTLNLLAPVAGALIGSGLHLLGVSTATGWGAAIWGGLGTWLYELAKNTTAFLGGSNDAPPTSLAQKTLK